MTKVSKTLTIAMVEKNENSIAKSRRKIWMSTPSTMRKNQPMRSKGLKICEGYNPIKEQKPGGRKNTKKYISRGQTKGQGTYMSSDYCMTVCTPPRKKKLDYTPP